MEFDLEKDSKKDVDFTATVTDPVTGKKIMFLVEMKNEIRANDAANPPKKGHSI